MVLVVLSRVKLMICVPASVVVAIGSPPVFPALSHTFALQAHPFRELLKASHESQQRTLHEIRNHLPRRKASESDRRILVFCVRRSAHLPSAPILSCDGSWCVAATRTIPESAARAGISLASYLWCVCHHPSTVIRFCQAAFGCPLACPRAASVCVRTIDQKA